MSSDERYYPTSLPVEWHGGGRKEEPDAMSASQVIIPGEAEMAAIHMEGKLCGNCKYFELSHGQTLMRQQRFVERLVREENWQVKHLCSPGNQLGVCGAHHSGSADADAMMTGVLHKGCDQWRPNNGAIR